MSSSESTIQFGTAYPYITNGFFERILRRELHDDSISVKDYTLKAALGKGENYASQMLRVKVDYSSINKPTNEISLILKAAITNNAEMTALTHEMGLFRKEISSFKKIIPEVEKLLRSIGDHTQLSARCYDADLELSYLVFEDLNTTGFANVNRRTGLDIDHLKLLLSKVSKWHAATAVILNENPIYAEEFKEPQFTLESSWRTIIENASLTLEEWATNGGHQKLAAKLQRLQSKIYEKTCMYSRLSANDLTVLCHGDIWGNNVLFTHSADGKANDILLCDFQTVYLGSPLSDITYLLYSSSQEDLNDRDWDLLLLHYHTELSTTLRKLKYNSTIPSLIDLQMEALYKGASQALMGLVVVGVRQLEDVSDDSVSHFMGNTDENRKYRINMLSSPKCRKSVEFLVDFFERKGFFECEE